MEKEQKQTQRPARGYDLHEVEWQDSLSDEEKLGCFEALMWAFVALAGGSAVGVLLSEAFGWFGGGK